MLFPQDQLCLDGQGGKRHRPSFILLFFTFEETGTWSTRTPVLVIIYSNYSASSTRWIPCAWDLGGVKGLCVSFPCMQSQVDYNTSAAHRTQRITSAAGCSSSMTTLVHISRNDCLAYKNNEGLFINVHFSFFHFHKICGQLFAKWIVLKIWSREWKCSTDVLNRLEYRED